jgi:predicted patatin/cPLA2 family phospholipase
MSVEVLGPQHVGMYDYAPHSVKDVMIDRLATESQRGERDDGFRVALAIEGGGYAGAVSAGMLVPLEQVGFIETVDEVDGTSTGALNGLSTAAGQAALGSINYIELLDTNFINPWRALGGRKIVNFDRLLGDLIRDRRPFDPDKLASGPAFGAVSVNLNTLETELLKDFDDIEDMMLATRASCALPLLTGPPVMYRGEPMSDGALLASVPFRVAKDNGATHVLALRTRGEDYRKDQQSKMNVAAVRFFGGSALASLVAGRPRLYNQDAEDLQEGSESVLQIALSGEQAPVERLEKSLARVQNGFELGVAAVGKAFGMPKLDVSWGQVPTIVANQHKAY